MNYPCSEVSPYNPNPTSCATNAVPQIKSHTHPLDEAETLLRLARYEEAGQRLNELWWELVSYPPTAHRQLAEAYIRSGWARLSFFQGDYAQAHDFALNTLELLKGVDDGEAVRVQAASVLSYVALYGEDFTAAWRYSEMALAGACRSNEPFALATALNGKGNLEWHSGNLAAAIATFEEALAIARTLTIPTLSSAICGNLAGLYRRQGDLTRSLHYAHRSLTIAEQSGDWVRACYALLRVGMVEMLLGNHEAAKSCFDRAYIAADLGDNPMVLLQVLKARAELAWLRGRHIEATQLAQQIISAPEKDGRASVLANALIVHIAAQCGDANRASIAYERMVSDASQLSSAIAEDDQYLALTARAMLRLAQGQCDAAQDEFAAALRKADSAVNPYSQGQVRLIYATALLNKDCHPARAADLLGGAQAIFTSMGAAYDVQRVAVQQARITYH